MSDTYAVIGSLTRDGWKRAWHLGGYVLNDLGIPTLVDFQLEMTGFAETYNNLLQAAFARPHVKYVWLLGDDVMPMANCLEETQQHMRDFPSIGAIFPVEAWQKDGEWITLIPPTGEQVTIQEAMERKDPPFEQLFAGFACTLIRREAWEAVGSMDESLGRGYSEDLDWGIRCWRAGYQCVSYRQAWFQHERGATYNALVEQGLYSTNEVYKSAARCKEKWPWLWNGEPFEETMARVKGWYEQARQGKVLA